MAVSRLEEKLQKWNDEHKGLKSTLTAQGTKELDPTGMAIISSMNKANKHIQDSVNVLKQLTETDDEKVEKLDAIITCFGAYCSALVNDYYYSSTKERLKEFERAEIAVRDALNEIDYEAQQEVLKLIAQPLLELRAAVTDSFGLTPEKRQAEKSWLKAAKAACPDSPLELLEKKISKLNNEMKSWGTIKILRSREEKNAVCGRAKTLMTEIDKIVADSKPDPVTQNVMKNQIKRELMGISKELERMSKETRGGKLAHEEIQTFVAKNNLNLKAKVQEQPSIKERIRQAFHRK